MNNDQIRFYDAGTRELVFAQKLVAERRVHPGVDFQFILDHGVYDCSKDVILLTVQGVSYTYPVNNG